MIVESFISDHYEHQDDQARTILIKGESPQRRFRDAWQILTRKYTPKIKVEIEDDRNIAYAIFSCSNPKTLSHTDPMLIRPQPLTRARVEEYTRESNLLLEAEKSERDQ